jgi:hypothetical protein
LRDENMQAIEWFPDENGKYTLIKINECDKD